MDEYGEYEDRLDGEAVDDGIEEVSSREMNWIKVQ
jgi:hypothetical protein